MVHPGNVQSGYVVYQNRRRWHHEIDCLAKHLHHVGILWSPNCTLYNQGIMDANHLNICSALTSITLTNRYWEAREKMMAAILQWNVLLFSAYLVTWIVVIVMANDENQEPFIKGGNWWDFGHFGQNSLFHFIELISSTYYYLWFSEVSDFYHCSAIIYQAICKFLCHLNTLWGVFSTVYFLTFTFWTFWQIQNAKASTIFKLSS